jgi:hypothetical protein
VCFEQVFDREGRHLWSIGDEPKSQSPVLFEARGAMSLDCDSLGNLIVTAKTACASAAGGIVGDLVGGTGGGGGCGCDGFGIVNSMVHIFGPNGAHITSFGKFGAHCVARVMSDHTGDKIYVLDHEHKTMQVFGFPL